MRHKMINPKFYIGTRDTRWDVYPQKQAEEVVAHDWHGFWARTSSGEWFKTPTSYVLVREIAEDEANGSTSKQLAADVQ